MHGLKIAILWLLRIPRRERKKILVQKTRTGYLHPIFAWKEGAGWYCQNPDLQRCVLIVNPDNTLTGDADWSKWFAM